METIKVNMNPNPLDVQTIHASQNDTEARQWEFELHNNGELIDTSDVKEQLVFKAYKGGTEQLLPENGSTPTTSPFLGDIRYPQGLLTDQEFTYRQSPTEEDGLAKITDIKGNTLVWNQLVQNGNFADGVNNWVGSGTTISASNGVLSVVPTGTSGTRFVYQNTNLLNGHKILYSLYLKLNKAATNSRLQFYNTQTTALLRTDNFSLTANVESFVTGIITMTSDFDRLDIQPIYSGQALTTDVFTVRNCVLFDLTLMFGAGNEPSTVDEFTSLFPLPYYAYDSGSLLSFNGTGIKTVGFNQWDEEWENGGISVTTGGSEVRQTSIRSKNFIPIFADSTYYFKLPSATYPFFYDENKNYIGFHGSGNTIYNRTFVPSELTNSVSGGSSFANAKYMKFRCDNGGTYEDNICLNFSSNKNGTYEPYTSSTLSLPTSTYFPTGMKSAGTVYDELTNSKAITRIGEVDLGSLTWAYAGTNSSEMRMYSDDINSLVKPSASTNVKGNLTCALYPNDTADATYLKQTCIAVNQTGRIFVYDPNYNTASSPSAFKTAMSGVYLYYELATPTETPITTASLITENAEIPLSNEDGVLIGKCTEQLSENPGFIDAKIKLSDADGECYSNKIQLHVERKPS